MNIITDFSQIEDEFKKIYEEITFQEFKAKVKVLGSPKIYKYTNGSTASLRRKALGPDKIHIREMPEHEMFYELAHEAGHATKPYFDHYLLAAEETKACFVQEHFAQHIVNKKLKSGEYTWTDNFLQFRKFRQDHIMRKDPKYTEYYEAAEFLIEEFNHDFYEGLDHITETAMNSRRY